MFFKGPFIIVLACFVVLIKKQSCNHNAKIMQSDHIFALFLLKMLRIIARSRPGF